MTFFLTKNLYFIKKILHLTFLLVTSYFSPHPLTLLLQILGGRMHGPSPTSIFLGGGGPSPQSPLKLRHYLYSDCLTMPDISLDEAGGRRYSSLLRQCR